MGSKVKITYKKPLFGNYAAQCICIPFTKFCFIRIRPEYREDVGLLEHELVHVEQHQKRPILNVFLYLLSSRYRLNAELEAYAKQLTFVSTQNKQRSLHRYTEFICNNYFLNYSFEYVLHKLKKKYAKVGYVAL